MHLLIDIRSRYPTETQQISYARDWVSLWTQRHPDDTITWLAHDQDDLSILPDISVIRIRKRGTWGTQKKIASHTNGPDRIISFSLCRPIDTQIKTLQHINDISEILYPRSFTGWFDRKKREYTYKHLLNTAHRIVVPSLGVGRELAEIFGTSEEKMCVIPYVIGEKSETKDISTLRTYGITPDFFIAEGTPGEEWNPLGLISAYAKYVHELGGTKKLIISGDMGDNLGHISGYIRSFDLIDTVKLIGVLPIDTKETLLAHASGWIYIGSYYSASTHITEAEKYQIPLILSDIPTLADYGGLHIHPNHIDELPAKIRDMHIVPPVLPMKDNEAIMRVYTKICAE